MLWLSIETGVVAAMVSPEWKVRYLLEFRDMKEQAWA